MSILQIKIIKNLGIFLLITACLTACGKKPNDNTNNPALKDLEAKEKLLLEELKLLVQDEDADLYSQYLAAGILVSPNTPTYVIREKLEQAIEEINGLEQNVKLQIPDIHFYKPGKEMEGTKKMLEFRKATRKKYEFILGVNNPS
jgi:hypothetical protein